MRNIPCGSSATGSRAGARRSLPMGTEFCREGCLRVRTVPFLVSMSNCYMRNGNSDSYRIHLQR